MQIITLFTYTPLSWLKTLFPWVRNITLIA